MGTVRKALRCDLYRRREATKKCVCYTCAQTPRSGPTVVRPLYARRRLRLHGVAIPGPFTDIAGRESWCYCPPPSRIHSAADSPGPLALAPPFRASRTPSRLHRPTPKTLKAGEFEPETGGTPDLEELSSPQLKHQGPEDPARTPPTDEQTWTGVLGRIS